MPNHLARVALVLSFALLGCRGAPAQPTANPDGAPTETTSPDPESQPGVDPDGPTLPARFASLFEPGAELIFEVTRSDDGHTTDDAPAEGSGVAHHRIEGSDNVVVTRTSSSRCAILEVQRVGDARVATTRCDAGPLPAVLVWRPGGLYESLDMLDADGVARLSDEDLWMRDEPEPVDVEVDVDGGTRWERVTRGDSTWCRATGFMGADLGSRELCFDDERGLVLLRETFDGGAHTEEEYRRAESE